MTGTKDPQSFLKGYVATHGLAASEGVPDSPDFTVDQRFVPLEEPPYRV
jgi:hypothetical protein